MINQSVNVGVVLRRGNDQRDGNFVQSFLDQVLQFWQRNFAFIISDISVYDPSRRNYQFLPSTILSPNEWNKVVGKINCKSFNRVFFAEKSQSFDEYCEFINVSILSAINLGIHGLSIAIDLTTDVVSLAQIINRHVGSSNLNFWIKIYITRTEIDKWLASKDKKNSLQIWYKWNEFRLLLSNTSNIGICLELGHIPDDCLTRLSNWFTEPLKCVIIDSRLFEEHSNGRELKLSPSVCEILYKTWKSKSTLAITNLRSDNQNLDSYYFEISKIFGQQPSPSAIEEFSQQADGLIQEPLQPLRDNLTSEIYNTFEMDRTKYDLYGQAISLALQALKIILKENVKEESANKNMSDEEIICEYEEKPLTVMVLGAGRGPLVTKVVEVSEELDVAIDLYVLEKNEQIIPTLMYLNETQWNDSVKLYVGDARTWDPPVKADLIVSELLGSFGDNELSPEVLDCAQRYLKDNGIMIPQNSESFIAPCQNQSVYSSIMSIHPQSHSPDSNENKFEKPYVVYSSKNKLLDKPQSVFKFDHPTAEIEPAYNSQQTLLFKAQEDAVVHCFEGYFSSTLADQIEISIMPLSATKNMFSWFPIVFPLKIPVQVKKGEEIELHMWRRNDNFSVWYEWTITKPIALPIHNTNGNSYKIML